MSLIPLKEGTAMDVWTETIGDPVVAVSINRKFVLRGLVAAALAASAFAGLPFTFVAVGRRRTQSAKGRSVM
jgi:hypothetical protein